jgi:hypothetical protein
LGPRLDPFAPDARPIPGFLPERRMGLGQGAVFPQAQEKVTIS